MSTTVSHFDCSDDERPVSSVIKSSGHHVVLSLTPHIGSSVRGRVTPKQARRMADALRVAAREAEANGRPSASTTPALEASR